MTPETIPCYARRPPRAARPHSSPAGGAAAAAALALFASCATYKDRTASALNDFQRGRLEEAQRAYADPDTTGSPFLQGAEAGTVALAAGDWDRAVRHLQSAAAAVEEIEERALVSATELGESVLSFALSERAKGYPGEGYERAMVHAMLALAYLAQGSLDSVYVEVRRADRLLRAEQELYQAEYAAGGLAHFASALAYELLDQPGEAYIDYRRMVEKDVGTELAGRALVRLSARLGQREDLERWSARFGPAAPLPEGAASIVLVAGVGLAPFKEQTTLTIPAPGGLLQWSVPRYVERFQPVRALELRAAGAEAAVRTSVIEDVSRVARANLDDRIGWLAAKSAVRAVLKRELTQQLQKNYDILGRIAGDVFTFVTERADLRAWLTLPDTWQAARLFVPPGRHALTVTALGGNSAVLGTYELDPGETMIVLARTVGTQLFVHPIGGLRVGGGREPAAAANPAVAVDNATLANP